MATMTQPQSRIRKTIITENLPSDNSPADAKPAPFYDRDWETVVQELSPAEWEGHLMRIYRSDEKWERGPGPVENVFTAPFTEDDIRARFGGGRYVMWFFGPPKRHKMVAKYRVELDGPPVIPSIPRNGTMPGADGSNLVAMQALQMMNNPEIMKMQLEMMKAATIQAIEMVKQQMPAPQDPLQTLRNAKEILGGGNHENSLIETIKLLKEIGVIGSPEKKGIDEILSLITTLKTSGLIPSGAPKSDLASTFASNLPMLADRVVAGIHEMRLSAESNERAMRLQRGEIRPDDPGVLEMPASQDPNAAAPAAANPATPIDERTAARIITQSHLVRIVHGIRQPNSTGEDLYDYLVNAWPEILSELAKLSKENLLLFFKSRDLQIAQLGSDTLAEVGEDPRLPQIIEDFLRIAKENEVAEPAIA